MPYVYFGKTKRENTIRKDELIYTHPAERVRERRTFVNYTIKCEQTVWYLCDKSDDYSDFEKYMRMCNSTQIIGFKPMVELLLLALRQVRGMYYSRLRLHLSELADVSGVRNIIMLMIIKLKSERDIF